MTTETHRTDCIASAQTTSSVHHGDVALSTAFTDLFSIPHPVALAPMAGSAGGELAAAVSAGGGLGLVGGGRGERDWWERELAVVTDRTNRAWGIGFLTWALTPATLDTALAHGPAAVMLSFGDPSPFAEDVRHRRRSRGRGRSRQHPTLNPFLRCHAP